MSSNLWLSGGYGSSLSLLNIYFSQKDENDKKCYSLDCRTGQSKNFTNPRLHYSNSHNSRTQCSLESNKDDPSTEFFPQGWNVNVPFISSEPRRPRPSFLIFLLTNVFVFCQEIRHPSSGNTLDFDELFIGVRSGPVFWRDEWWWLVVLLMDEKVSSPP